MNNNFPRKASVPGGHFIHGRLNFVGLSSLDNERKKESLLGAALMLSCHILVTLVCPSTER